MPPDMHGERVVTPMTVASTLHDTRTGECGPITMMLLRGCD
jgi:hypothetical protein